MTDPHPPSYIYVKERKTFGKECLFSFKNKLLVSEPTNQQLFSEYIYRNPADHDCQYKKEVSLSVVNTVNKIYVPKGVNHTDGGGWPKTLFQNANEEHGNDIHKLQMKYKNRILNDEQFKTRIELSMPILEHTIQQNNSINIYENFYDDNNQMDENPIDREQYHVTTIQCFRDPQQQAAGQSFIKQRSSNHISFSPDGGQFMAVAYTDENPELNNHEQSDSYVWDIENPNKPIINLPSKSASCINLKYNLRDNRLIAGGLSDGKLCIWDTRTVMGAINQNNMRRPRGPELITAPEVSHKECVTSVLWNSSKTNTELFSGSMDGQIFWWDIRTMNKPIDRLLCDPQKKNDQLLSRSYGCSVLEFEFTIPTRFMIGTHEGIIFSCNRKGKTPIEQITNKIKCQSGPIYSLERNPSFVKNFLTVGDHRLSIWSEDCKESATIWSMEHKDAITCGTWSRTRSSLLFIGRSDGTIDFWDILLDKKQTIANLKVSNTSICHNRSHFIGNLMATGDQSGNVYLVRLSENMMRMEKNDRSQLAAMFEREIKREKILEGKVRELKLKVKPNKSSSITKNADNNNGYNDVDDDDDGNKKKKIKNTEEINNIEIVFNDIIKSECKRRQMENNIRVISDQKQDELQEQLNHTDDHVELIISDDEDDVKEFKDTKVNESDDDDDDGSEMEMNDDNRMHTADDE